MLGYGPFRVVGGKRGCRTARLCLGWNRLIGVSRLCCCRGRERGHWGLRGRGRGRGRCPLFEPCSLHCRRGRGRPFHGFSVSVFGGSGGRGGDVLSRPDGLHTMTRSFRCRALATGLLRGSRRGLWRIRLARGGGLLLRVFGSGRGICRGGRRRMPVGCDGCC